MKQGDRVTQATLMERALERAASRMRSVAKGDDREEQLVREAMAEISGVIERAQSVPEWNIKW